MSDLQSGVPNIIEKGIRDARALSSRMRRGQGEYGAQSKNFFSNADRVLCSRVADHLDGIADAADVKLRQLRGDSNPTLRVSGLDDRAARDQAYAGFCSELSTAWQR
jgi:hypothetical protein